MKPRPLQAGGVGRLRALGAYLLEVREHGFLEARYLRQILVPHLPVREDGVDELLRACRSCGSQ